MRFQYLEYATELEIEGILEIFPEARAVLTRDLIDLKEHLKEEEPKWMEIYTLMVKEAHKIKEGMWAEPEWKKLRLDLFRNIFYNIPVGNIDKRIHKLERILRGVEWKRKPPEGGVTDSDIAAAKDADLWELMGEKENESGFVKCPFHPEKTGSFKIYEGTRWFCYGACGQGGDTIDFVMKRDSLDFVNAVRKIIHK